MNPGQAALELQKAATTLMQEIHRAESQTVDEGVAKATAASSGPFSLKELAELGHPYSQRDPQPPQDPANINEQSGQFKRDWKGTAGVIVDGEMHSQIVNDAPYADFLDQGTRLMIARPIVQLIQDEIAGTRQHNLDEAKRRAGF